MPCTCGSDWKAIDVSHGSACPKTYRRGLDTPNGVLIRVAPPILNAKSIGLTTLADITEEEFPVLEIETERQEQMPKGGG